MDTYITRRDGKTQEDAEIHSSIWKRLSPVVHTALPSLILLFFLASCGKGEATARIDEDKLIEALIDVHVAEAAVQSLRGATKDSMANLYYDQIFEIHGLNREEFETTMEKYRSDPKRMEALYAKVMTEMERQEVAEEEEEGEYE